MGEREVIFEIRRIGTFAKVSAVDVASGIEVSVTGPASATDATLHRAALAKLDRALGRRARRPPPDDPPADGGVTA